MLNTLLQVVQDVCGRSGVPTPLNVIGNQSQQVAQMLALLQEVGEYVQTNFDGMEIFTRDVTWTSFAGEDQGLVVDLLGTEALNALDFIVPDTFWDRSLRRQVAGATTDAEYQALQTLANVGPFYRFRIANGHLLMSPAMPAGHTMALTWRSLNWIVTGPAAPTPNMLANTFTTDGDTIRLDPLLIRLGLRSTWRREKGLPYADLWAQFNERCKKVEGRNKVARDLNMDGAAGNLRPGIWVPSGNWNV